ncbi:MAG: excinuclease ABC subunit UvrA [Planctomycetia bacterium]|nr:excinuclease ABC subunit UvrA [Planctomycetia bacterium]
MASERFIRLRGVEVHNLKHIDLDIPHRKLVVLCGVSGSGKSSLALDTLYAEGQRRYIESFSSYARQFLDRLERPAAELIEGIPPAIAVVRQNLSRSGRATVATATEIHDYLRLLLARAGEVHCTGCGAVLRRHDPQTAAEEIRAWPAGLRFLVAFPVPAEETTDAEQLLAELQREGLRRVVVGKRVVSIEEPGAAELLGEELVRVRSGRGRGGDGGRGRQGKEEADVVRSEAMRRDAESRLLVVVDRLTSGDDAPAKRLVDSLETAFARGNGRALALVEGNVPGGVENTLDRRTWRRFAWSDRLRCEACGIEALAPEPRLFSFQSALGSCPACEGFGTTLEMDLGLVVPDKKKTLREGAIAPWNTAAYAHELEELIALAGDYEIPLDVPFAELPAQALRHIHDGVPERKFGGLAGFFAWLQRNSYKTPVRAFLSRWRTVRTCSACQGQRLRPEALAVKWRGKNIAEMCAMEVGKVGEFFAQIVAPKSTGATPVAPGTGQRPVAPKTRDLVGTLVAQIRSRLEYLAAVGLSYLTLDRPMRTLSGGEAQRVSLTAALGSGLVNPLYVLDEPSVGLHPRDTQRLLAVVRKLRDRGNSVVVVEHEEAFLRGADHAIEIGPGAGTSGGQVVFQGTPQEMIAGGSMTGDFLAGRRGLSAPQHRPAQRGRLRLIGARGNNLKDLTVDFPLGVLCAVTGVSGAGKTTLVEETLFPALCQRLGKDAPPPLAYTDLTGEGQIKDVVFVDSSPVARSARSNPVTYVKAFDEIRAVFAETTEAKIRNYAAGHFSFNVEGGRCETCQGEGQIEIDMQFLPDVYMTCPACRGRRYRSEILQVKHRDRNIAEVLQMTVREAFSFFRGQRKAQAGLKRLMDVGLDYVRLGQNANTLSGGEAQRLKLAGFLAGSRRGRTLFLLDEPTTGLHFADVIKLLDCFSALVAEGHSIIVIEHNVQLLRHCDWIIDLGPGAAEEGGRIVCQGTPEEVAGCRESETGRFLRMTKE